MARSVNGFDLTDPLVPALEIPSVVACWFAWHAFFPKTEVFTARPGG